jgi:hypothetical protein
MQEQIGCSRRQGKVRCHRCYPTFEKICSRINLKHWRVDAFSSNDPVTPI